MHRLLEHGHSEVDRLSNAIAREKAKLAAASRPDTTSTMTALQTAQTALALERAEKAMSFHESKMRIWKDKHRLIDAIANIVEYFSPTSSGSGGGGGVVGGRNHFEVPFLQAHRKDYFSHFFDRADLWAIYDLDTQYHQLRMKRNTVKQTLHDLRAVSDLALRDLYPDRLLDDAEACFEDIVDVLGYLQLHYGSDLQRAEEKRRSVLIKRSIKRSAFEDARRFGLHEFVKVRCVCVFIS